MSSHKNLKRAWNLLVLKNARLERASARARGREYDREGEISLPLPRTLAISSLAFFKGMNSSTFGVFMWKSRVFKFK